MGPLPSICVEAERNGSQKSELVIPSNIGRGHFFIVRTSHILDRIQGFRLSRTRPPLPKITGRRIDAVKELPADLLRIKRRISKMTVCSWIDGNGHGPVLVRPADPAFGSPIRPSSLYVYGTRQLHARNSVGNVRQNLQEED